MRVLVLLALVATLGGCMGRSPEQRFAEAQNACTAYGFQPGTETYAQCLMQLDVLMVEQDYRRRQAIAADLQRWADSQRSVTCNTHAHVSGGGGFYPSYSGTSTTTCR